MPNEAGESEDQEGSGAAFHTLILWVRQPVTSTFFERSIDWLDLAPNPHMQWCENALMGARSTDQFAALCQSHGVIKQSLRIEFVTAHSCGGSNVRALVKPLEKAYWLYGRPLWITEFAAGDCKARTRAESQHRPEQIIQFIEQLVPRLDRCPFFEHYAWFSADQCDLNYHTTETLGYLGITASFVTMRHFLSSASAIRIRSNGSL